MTIVQFILICNGFSQKFFLWFCSTIQVTLFKHTSNVNFGGKKTTIKKVTYSILLDEKNPSDNN